MNVVFVLNEKFDGLMLELSEIKTLLKCLDINLQENFYYKNVDISNFITAIDKLLEDSLRKIDYIEQKMM